MRQERFLPCQRVLDVNLASIYRTCRALVPGMAAGGGHWPDAPDRGRIRGWFCTRQLRQSRGDRHRVSGEQRPPWTWIQPL